MKILLMHNQDEEQQNTDIMPEIKSTDDLVYYKIYLPIDIDDLDVKERWRTLIGRRSNHKNKIWIHTGHMNQFGRLVNVPENAIEEEVWNGYYNMFVWNPNLTQLNPCREAHPNAYGKSYLVHFNGGRPFLVYVRPDVVSIFKIPTDKYIRKKDYDQYDNKLFYQEHIHTIENYQNIWIGGDCMNYGIHCTEPDEEFYVGNTILVHKNNNTYVWIGSEVIMFNIDSPVENYYSPIGNSDVPYPIILTKDYVYYVGEQYKVRREFCKIDVDTLDWIKLVAFGWYTLPKSEYIHFDYETIHEGIE